MLEIRQFTFQNAASAAGTGEVLNNEQGSSLTVVVTGTFTADVTMQGRLAAEWFDLAVVNLKTLEVADKISEEGAFAVAGVDGFEAIRANITSFTSGDVSAVGRLVF